MLSPNPTSTLTTRPRLRRRQSSAASAWEISQALLPERTLTVTPTLTLPLTLTRYVKIKDVATGDIYILMEKRCAPG